MSNEDSIIDLPHFSRKAPVGDKEWTEFLQVLDELTFVIKSARLRNMDDGAIKQAVSTMCDRLEYGNDVDCIKSHPTSSGTRQ